MIADTVIPLYAAEYVLTTDTVPQRRFKVIVTNGESHGKTVKLASIGLVHYAIKSDKMNTEEEFMRMCPVFEEGVISSLNLPSSKDGFMCK
jgi:hypothetical protein